jgi:hypothetical protein
VLDGDGLQQEHPLSAALEFESHEELARVAGLRGRGGFAGDLPNPMLLDWSE